MITSETFAYRNNAFTISETVKHVTFYTKPKTSLIITPSFTEEQSNDKKFKNLIFFPKFKTLNVERECVLDSEDLVFELKVGVMMEGKISPPLKDVEITAYLKDTEHAIAQAITDELGQYKIGPLYSEYKYSLIAKLTGYKIVRETETSYNFNSEKLSFLKVYVVDRLGGPLNGALISLSSSEKGFSVNQITDEEGVANFTDLFKGEYSIKPVLKEYELTPAQKQLKIEGGTHYEENFVGVRVAYSAFGKSNILTSTVDCERKDRRHFCSYR